MNIISFREGLHVRVTPNNPLGYGSALITVAVLSLKGKLLCPLIKRTLAVRCVLFIKRLVSCRRLLRRRLLLAYALNNQILRYTT